MRLVADGMDVQAAVEAPRVHFEAGAVQAEPGIDEQGLDALAARGYQLVRWQERNLFFGGVHAVARDPATGELQRRRRPAAGRRGRPRLRGWRVASVPEPMREVRGWPRRF